jgi:hypothetical protein
MTGSARVTCIRRPAVNWTSGRSPLRLVGPRLTGALKGLLGKKSTSPLQSLSLNMPLRSVRILT